LNIVQRTTPMPQYLLPCSCGQQVRVEPAQAGGQIACQCGQSLTVPTLRALRMLDPAGPDAATSRQIPRGQWSRTQGALFSIGLAIAVISLAILAYTFFMFVQATPLTRDYTPELSELSSQQVDQLTALETYEEFFKMTNEGLGEMGTPLWIHFQQVVAEQKVVMIGSGVAALLGILAVLASFFVGSAKQPASR